MKKTKRILAMAVLVLLISCALGITAFAALSPAGYEEENGFINGYSAAPSDYAYSFAVVCDTQTVVKKDIANNTQYLSSIYDWIVSNAESKKIGYVFGLGDITENDTDEEWTYAKEHITKLDGVVPYLLNRGNSPHDTAKQMNKYFASHTDYTDTLSGTMTEGDVVNSYTVFTVGGVKYLVLAIDFGPSDAELEWAGGIIEANPDCKVIITTHAYLYTDGTLQDANDGSAPNKTGADDGSSNNGDMMWEKLVKKHSNIIMVLSGHNPTPDIIYNRDTGDHGNTVTSILVDSQNFDAGREGETGMVCMLYFSEDGSRVDVEYISTVREQYYKESNQFSINLKEVATDVVTKYGVIPAQYADALEWPFAVFKKESTTIDGVKYDYTFVSANKVLMADSAKGLTTNNDLAFHKARSAGEGAVILMRRDFVDTSTSAYSNLSYNSGTVTLDLGGFTLTDRHTNSNSIGYFYCYTKTDNDIIFRIENGSFVLDDLGLTHYSVTSGKTGSIGLEFENVRFSFTEDSTVSNVLARFTGDNLDLFSVNFKDCVIDLANARPGVNMLTTGMKKGAVDITLENTPVINPPAVAMKFNATLADGFLLNIYVKAATSNSNITHGTIVFDGIEYATDDCEKTKVGTIDYYKFTKEFSPNKTLETVNITLKLNYAYKYADGSVRNDTLLVSRDFSVMDYLETVVKTKTGTSRQVASDALSYIKASYVYSAAADAEEACARVDKLLGAGYDEKNAPAIPEAAMSVDGLASAQLKLGSSPYFVFEVDGYDAENFVFALDGKYLLESEIVTEGGAVKHVIKLNAFAIDNDIEYIIQGTGISGVYNIGAYYEFAEDNESDALVDLVERLIKYAESAEAYRNSVIS